jgi:hypothetical protein
MLLYKLFRFAVLSGKSLIVLISMSTGGENCDLDFLVLEQQSLRHVDCNNKKTLPFS